MLRSSGRAASALKRSATSASTRTIEFHTVRPTRGISTTRLARDPYNPQAPQSSSSGGSSFKYFAVLAALGGGALAFDKKFGPITKPDADWSEWLDVRRQYYAREIGKLGKSYSQGISKEYKQDVFFAYERRLRSFSPPEKVFEYFASVSKDGSTYMTLSDLVRALLPLHPAVGSGETRAGKLQGETDGKEIGVHLDKGEKLSKEVMRSKLFELFDTDGNGLFDFAEYLFFHTMISVDRATATALFHKYDEDGNSSLDAQEFVHLMKDMREQGNKRATGLRTGLKTGVEDVNEIGDGLLNYLFGPKRNKKLKKSAFLKFLHDLRSEMDDLEFSHYDTEGEGKITARDFGYALVAGSKVHELPLFLSKVKTLPGREARNRVSRADFIAFCKLAKHGDGSFQTKMQEISDSGAPISRKRFAKLAKKTMGVKLSREVINIIFHVFDVDGDDSLSYEEFFNALITWK